MQESIKKKIGIINIPPIVGVLLLLKCDFGPSALMFCKKLFFLINSIPYLVEIVDAMTEKIYKIKIYGLFI